LDQLRKIVRPGVSTTKADGVDFPASTGA